MATSTVFLLITCSVLFGSPEIVEASFKERGKYYSEKVMIISQELTIDDTIIPSVSSSAIYQYKCFVLRMYS